MKISALYSNQETKFHRINFNTGLDGSAFNVILAEVTKPKDGSKDSHNLGKTTLIHLIDFCLLRSVSDGEHFLAKHELKFKDFIFYIELLLNDGSFLTICREVENPTHISLKRHEEGGQDLLSLGEDEWDHRNIALARAVEIVDSSLNLDVIKPWTYRKGVTYFLRTQDDYRDYFQISKFSTGKHIDWKPYVAKVLGFDYEAIKKKYEIDNAIEEKNKLRAQYQQKLQIAEKEIPKLKNSITLKNQEIENLSNELDSFSFEKEEARINKELVNELEKKVSVINNQIYNLGFDISKIRDSIEQKVAFSIEKIKTLFEEAEVLLPDQLVHDYAALESFNKRISSERRRALKKQLSGLETLIKDLEKERADLDQQRQDYLSVVRGSDTFEKYKALQKELSDRKASMLFLEGQLDKVSALSDLKKEIKQLNLERAETVDQIELSLDEDAEDETIYKKIALELNDLVIKVLNKPANFYVNQNKEGNIEFNIDIESDSSDSQKTSQSEGTTYKKLLCALFDIAVLKTYSDSSFYHFVYHDGLLEGLDNRKKRAVLEVVQDVAASSNIQYILSVIDSDLPRDDKDQKVSFPDSQVVLNLDDSGEQGRLFKTEEF